MTEVWSRASAGGCSLCDRSCVRIGRERVGLRGATVLGLAGAVGLALAVSGYGHGTLVGVGAGGAVGRVTQSSAKNSNPAKRSGATHATSTTTTAPASTAPKQRLGPTLSSTQYASFAYRLYPGQETSQAQAATSGFDIRVTPGKNTITVKISSVGSAPGRGSVYPAGDQVYFLETSFGDDSGGSDYNYGDDGVIITNSSGRIVQ